MLEKFLNILFFIITFVGMASFINLLISNNKIIGIVVAVVYIFSFINFIAVLKEKTNGKENKRYY